jgi:uncharacterized protein YhaN
MSTSPYVDEIRQLFTELQGITAMRAPTPATNGGVGWTIDSLKQHFDQRLVDQDKAVQAALVAAEKAVSAALVAAERARETAETNAEKWRQNANEWRGAMTDREAKFVLKTEMESEIKALQADNRTVKNMYDAIKERLDKGTGGADHGKALKDESRANVAILIAAAAVLVALLVGLSRVLLP